MRGFRLTPPSYQCRWLQDTHTMIQSMNLIRLLHTEMNHLAQSSSCLQIHPWSHWRVPGLWLSRYSQNWFRCAISQRKLIQETARICRQASPARLSFHFCPMACAYYLIFNLFRDHGNALSPRLPSQGSMDFLLSSSPLIILLLTTFILISHFPIYGRAERELLTLRAAALFIWAITALIYVHSMGLQQLLLNTAEISQIMGLSTLWRNQAPERDFMKMLKA